MNNKETIEQVERGYRMANPVHIVYPESKTCPKELAQAQSNVYKVSLIYIHVCICKCKQGVPEKNAIYGEAINLTRFFLGHMVLCIKNVLYNYQSCSVSTNIYYNKSLFFIEYFISIFAIFR